MAESVVYLLAEKIGVFLEENKKKLPREAIQDAEFIKAELERMSVILRFAEREEYNVDPLINKALKLAFDIEDIIDEFKSPVGMKHESFASKMLSIISRITDVSVELQRFKSEVVTEASSSGPYHKAGVDLSLQNADADIVGIDNPKRQLLEWLTDEDPSFKVISVVGMAGVGKTTLVKKVYQDVAVLNYFDFHAWITVSDFRLEELLRDLIQPARSFYGQTAPEGIETMGSYGLKKILKLILRGIRCLVVVDDVRNLYSWDAIKDALPLSDSGSRVLLTTCNREIANTVSSVCEGRVYSLMPLSSDMSWQLFYNTFKHQECPAHLMDVTQNIVSRCEGLPLAIVAIANTLSTMIDRRSSYPLIMFDNSIVLSKLICDRLGRKSKILHNYYDLTSHLKACLLYASLFSAYKINCAELLRLWMAEGFVRKEDGKTEEQVANRYLHELVNRSLIQVCSSDLAEDGSILQCRIHGILRGVLLSKSRIERFASFIDEHRFRGWSEEARRMCVHDTSLSYLKFIFSFRPWRLRTLINWRSSDPLICPTHR